MIKREKTRKNPKKNGGLLRSPPAGGGLRLQGRGVGGVVPPTPLLAMPAIEPQSRRLQPMGPYPREPQPTSNRDILVNRNNPGYFYTCYFYHYNFNIISKHIYLTLNYVSFIRIFESFNQIKNIKSIPLKNTFLNLQGNFQKIESILEQNNFDVLICFNI